MVVPTSRAGPAWVCFWLPAPETNQDLDAWKTLVENQVMPWLDPSRDELKSTRLTLAVHGRDATGRPVFALAHPGDGDKAFSLPWAEFVAAFSSWRESWAKAISLHPGSAADGLALLLNVLQERLPWEHWDGPVWIEHWPASEVNEAMAFLKRSLCLMVVQGQRLVPPSRSLDAPLPGEVLALAPPSPWTLQSFWVARSGNAPDEWEDAFAFDPVRGALALGDGASEGIFVKSWARILVDQYVKQRPDLTNKESRRAWLQQCREDWRASIRYGQLRTHQKMKVDRVGGAATLLTFRVFASPDPGLLHWLAFSVGDCCLFWFREDTLWATFPIVRAEQFGRGPALLRTNGELDSPLPVQAQGVCRPGDVFLLATDAVAQWLFRTIELGEPLPWAKLRTLTPAAWTQWVDQLRRDDNIVNDDCTILIGRISFAGESNSVEPGDEPV